MKNGLCKGRVVAEVVRAELGKDTAWTGAAVPLIVTLYSPGPFSGTASFMLPELPKTAFVRAGNPVVGSGLAGDVIARTISRRAAGTTAMMFPPVAVETPPGVRFYSTEPIVQDFTERGDSRAERSETIKYQFERAGTFELPDVSVIWWDPDAGELKRATLTGKLVDVRTAAVASELPAPTPRSRRPLAVLLLMAGLAAWLIRRAATRWLAAREARRSDPATTAARRLLAACRANAAAEAYAALLQWKRAVDLPAANLGELLPPDAIAEFEHESNVLSRHVFGAGSSGSPWAGQRLAGLFVRVRRKLGQGSRTRSGDGDLPALNPISSPDGC